MKRNTDHVPEAEFKAILRRERPRPTHGRSIQSIAQDLGIPLKRVGYWLDKWTDRGEWNYGVSPWGGWFEKPDNAAD